MSLLAITKPDFPLEVFTAPCEMGETSAHNAGFTPQIIGAIQSGATTSEDTQRTAREMSVRGLHLILFAGGDGTARDICASVPEGFPCLGIPAGVKIHSGVYATNPRHAGELTQLFLDGKAPLRESEVLDLDEDAYREGRVSARLYGYLHVPYAAKPAKKSAKEKAEKRIKKAEKEIDQFFGGVAKEAKKDFAAQAAGKQPKITDVKPITVEKKKKRTARVKIREKVVAEAEPVKVKVGKAPKGERIKTIKKSAPQFDADDTLFCEVCGGEFEPAKMKKIGSQYYCPVCSKKK